MTPLAVVLAAAGWLSLGGSEGIPVETWCRARCAEVFRGEVKRPRCKRYEPEWYVEEGKAKERRKFNQPCLDEYAAWSARVEHRQAAAEALKDEAGCTAWCGRLGRLRHGFPYPAAAAELWDVLADVDACGLDEQVLLDLARLDIPVWCDGMALVPAGAFGMGCNLRQGVEECRADELPFHEVELPAYFIDRHEVTVAAYKQCADADKCSEPYGSDLLRYYNWGNAKRLLHPVNGVDWGQAVAFCGWKGKRLCTEAEWEKGARGTDGRLYPWGDERPDATLAVIDTGADRVETGQIWPVLGVTEPVCSREKGNSPHRLCDMAGNVMEWTADWYDAGYYAQAPAASPPGPASGVFRAIRGGRYAHVGFTVRASARYFLAPGDHFVYLGFRCCADAAYEGR